MSTEKRMRRPPDLEVARNRAVISPRGRECSDSDSGMRLHTSRDLVETSPRARVA